MILHSGRELPRAERLLRKYLAATPEGNAPTLSEARWQLGLVLEKEARLSEAVVEWSESVRLDSESPAKRELARLAGRGPDLQAVLAGQAGRPVLLLQLRHNLGSHRKTTTWTRRVPSPDLLD